MYYNLNEQIVDQKQINKSRDSYSYLFVLMLWMQTWSDGEKSVPEYLSPTPLCPSSLSQRDLNSNTHVHTPWEGGGLRVTVIVMIGLCWQITALSFFITMCVNPSACQDGINKQTSMTFTWAVFSQSFLSLLKYLKLQVRIGPSLLFYASSVHPNERKYVFGKLELHFFHPEANSQQPHPNSLSC